MVGATGMTTAGTRDVTVTTGANGSVTVTVTAHGDGDEVTATLCGVTASAPATGGVGSVRLVIDDPVLWWPTGLGAQALHDLTVTMGQARAQRRIGLTLLMGLDLPWVPDGLFRDGPAVREAIDALLRRELQGAGIGFQTVYGQGTRRLQAALRAVGAALGRELLPDDPLLREGSGRWACEACSDPDCEHRLFSALLARRGG